MSDAQEAAIRDLWSNVGKMRDDVAEVKELVIEMKASLAERCTARDVRLCAVESKVSEMQHKIWFFSGAAAVIGALASWLLKK